MHALRAAPSAPRCVAPLLLAAALAAAGCGHAGAGARRADGVSPAAWEVSTARFLAFDALVVALARHRYVLLGELHDSPHHHRLQARVLRGLVAAGRRPAVVFEMLSADQAGALAAVAARPDADPEALRHAVAWDATGWPAFDLYAPVFAAALEAGLPLAAGDLGADARSALRREGVAGLGASRRRELGLGAPATRAERAVLGAAIREGHCDLLPEAALPRMIEMQRARDAQLAAALRDAARQPGVDGAVLVAGAGHVRRDVAVPAWLTRVDSATSVASLAFVEVETLPETPARALAARFGEGKAAPFDYVVFTRPTPREDPCEALRRQLESHGGAAGRGARDAG